MNGYIYIKNCRQARTGRWSQRVLTLVCLFCSASIWADQPRVPLPKVFAAPNHQYYLKLLPDDASLSQDRAQGAVYHARQGQDELQYSVSGWYTHSAVLSTDGQFIARLGAWPDFDAKPEQTLALAFYHKGRLVKRYNVADLITDLSQLKFSVSHYSWGGGLAFADDVRTDTQVHKSHDGKEYRVVSHYANEIVQVSTVEGKILKFYLATGERFVSH